MKIKFLQNGPGSQRVYYLLISAIVLVLASLLAGAYGVNGMLGTKADKLSSLKAKKAALDQEQLDLTAAKRDVTKYAGLLQITRSIVPEDKDQAEAVREIVNLAAANTISLATITFPASSLGNAASGVTAGGAVGTATTTPSATQLNADSSTARLSQLLPVKSIPGVYALQITVQGDPNKPVQYSSFINFLTALENNRRTAEISSITLQPSAASPNLLVFSLTLNEYIKP